MVKYYLISTYIFNILDTYFMISSLSGLDSNISTSFPKDSKSYLKS